MIIMKVKIINFQTEAEVVVIHPDRDDPSSFRSNLATLRSDVKQRLVRVIKAPLVAENELGLGDNLARTMGVVDGNDIVLTGRKKPQALPAIMKKYDHQKWTSDDMRLIVDDIYNGNLSDLEMAAFTLTMQYDSLDTEETEHLTKAFTIHGETIEFNEPVYDKHSIGGIPGNKVSLIIVPIVAAAGLLIPKTSSRAITSPSGTADTMEVLANVKFSAEEIQAIAPKTRGMLVWGGQLNLAPVDSEIITRVERPLSLDPESVIIASILSKKLSTGVKHLVLDMPTGAETKMPSRSQAQDLSMLFVEIGRRVGIQVECAITYADQIVGHSAGPALEAREALNTLMGNGPRSVLEKSVELSGILFEMAGIAQRGKGALMAMEIVQSGKALKKFREIIGAQGGDPNVTPENIEVGKYQTELKAPKDGYIAYISNSQLKSIAAALGCPADKKSGVILHRKIGEFVKEGDTIMELFASREGALDHAIQIAKTKSPFRQEGMVLERIGSGSIDLSQSADTDER